MTLNQLSKKMRSRDLEHLKAILIRWAHYATNPQVKKRLLASNQKCLYVVMPSELIPGVTREDLRLLAYKHMNTNDVGVRKIRALKSSS